MQNIIGLTYLLSIAVIHSIAMLMVVVVVALNVTAVVNHYQC